MNELISTLEAASEFDALAKIQEGEPHFLLLGRDRLAPPLIQKWADDNRERALREFAEGKIDEEKRDRELRKSTQAEAVGWAMQSFKAGDLAKRALEQPTAKFYSGVEVPEETKIQDRLQSLRISAAAALNNAVAETSDLLEFMAAIDQDGDLRSISDRLGSTLRAMRAAAEELVPNPRKVLGLAKAKRA